MREARVKPFGPLVKLEKNWQFGFLNFSFPRRFNYCKAYVQDALRNDSKTRNWPMNLKKYYQSGMRGDNFKVMYLVYSREGHFYFYKLLIEGKITY